MWRIPVSDSQRERSSQALRADGLAVDGTTAQPSAGKTQPSKLKPLLMRAWLAIVECNWAAQRRQPQSNASAQSRARSRWPQIVRLGVVLSLPVWLSSCAIWQKLAPQNVMAVCADSVARESCPAPSYTFADGDIPGDVAAAVALAEAKARDACSAQLDELQGCVKRHNEGAK